MRGPLTNDINTTSAYTTYVVRRAVALHGSHDRVLVPIARKPASIDALLAAFDERRMLNELDVHCTGCSLTLNKMYAQKTHCCPVVSSCVPVMLDYLYAQKTYCQTARINSCKLSPGLPHYCVLT